MKLPANQKVSLQSKLQRVDELVTAGDYEAARDALAPFWQGVGHRPVLDGLDPHRAAELLLRAGTLTGWLGSVQQLDGSQESAKDLLSEAGARFAQLELRTKIAETKIELGYCYWREGAFDEARIILKDAIDSLTDVDGDLKIKAFIRASIVERAAKRLHKALSLLQEIAPLVNLSDRHALKGQWHSAMSLTLQYLEEHNLSECFDPIVSAYRTAKYHFEQAGHKRYVALVENNLGLLFFTATRYEEAHEHLSCARRLYAGLRDGTVAQVDETRARVFLAAGQLGEAEEAARAAVRRLEKGGQQALLVEALTTHATALARLGEHDLARVTLERAITLAQVCGDKVGAGRAALTLIEELWPRLTHGEKQSLTRQADEFIGATEDISLVQRVRLCALRLLSTPEPRLSTPSDQLPIFLHASPRMTAVTEQARQLALARVPVLLTGEMGTGKETLARLIHERSQRPGKFIVVNCATMREEPFGERNQAGTVRQAAGGTLYLEGIGEFSHMNQAKALRLAEAGEVWATGSALPERIDVRIIAASRYGLYERVKSGEFRQDLYYSLLGGSLYLPPLRERPEDIAVLARHFILQTYETHGAVSQFSAEAIAALQRLPLFGNARELRALIEHLAVAHREGLVTAEAVESFAHRRFTALEQIQAGFSIDFQEEIHRCEHDLIEEALRASGGRISDAARRLGFKHHQSLSCILESRHQDLLSCRLPVQPRKHKLELLKRDR